MNGERSVPALSVIVPLHNEEANVPLLVEGVRAALDGGEAWELILVDDGSRDGTAAAARAAQASDPRIRLLRLARNYGQTAAMQAGFDHARGAIVVSMDGDLQNDPADIPRLVAGIREGYDLVAGYRVRRKDNPLTRKLPSWVANRIIRALTGVDIRDNGCSLKAYRAEVIRSLHLYSDLHRFIPAVAAATSGARITELPVRHHPRRYGRSKYGLSRVWKVLVDLVTINMIRSFRERPLLLFGWTAIVSGAIGTALALAAALTYLGLVPRPEGALVLPTSALLCFTLAAYLLMLGLIAEVGLRSLRRRAPATLPLAREVFS